MLRQLIGSRPGDDAILFEIGLVADDHERDVLIVFDADDLFAKLGQLVEAAHAGDGEDEEETLALLHIQLSHGRKLFRAGCVKAVEVRICKQKGYRGKLGEQQRTFRGCIVVPVKISFTISETPVSVEQMRRTSTSICFLYESSIVGS